MAKNSVSFSSRLALMLAFPTANSSVSLSSGLTSMLTPVCHGGQPTLYALIHVKGSLKLTGTEKANVNVSCCKGFTTVSTFQQANISFSMTSHQQDQYKLCFGAGLCCFFPARSAAPNSDVFSSWQTSMLTSLCHGGQPLLNTLIHVKGNLMLTRTHKANAKG